MANTNGTAVAYGEITILDLLDDATYIYYSDDSSGSGASLSPTGKSYIGIYNGPALSTGQPAPDTQEYTDIKRDIKWSQYVGEDGKDGNGIVSTEIRYQNGSSSTDKPEGAWSEKIPAAESGKYLWTRTTLTYADGTTSVSYSVGAHGEDGQDGQDGDKYLIGTNVEEVLRFYTNAGVEFSPDVVKFSVFEFPDTQNAILFYEEDNKADTRKASFVVQVLYDDKNYTIDYYYGDNQYEQFDWLSESLQDKSSVYEYLNEKYTLTSDEQAVEGKVYYRKKQCYISLEKFEGDAEGARTVVFNLADWYNHLPPEDISSIEGTDITVSELNKTLYIRILYYENNKVVAIKPVQISNGFTGDMAKFSLNAADITAAINSAQLKFDVNGLHITNGGFDIVKTVQSDGGEEKTAQLLYLDNSGNLQIAGDSYFGGTLTAANGTFKGELVGVNGTFEGSITARGGSIGGFKIGETQLTSTHLEKVEYKELEVQEDETLDGEIYILKEGSYVITTDEQAKSGTTYYERVEYPSIVLDGAVGRIEAQNLILGMGTTIKDYINIGNNVKLYGSSSAEGHFIEVGTNYVLVDQKDLIEGQIYYYKESTTTGGIPSEEWRAVEHSSNNFDANRSYYKKTHLMSFGSNGLLDVGTKIFINGQDGVISSVEYGESGAGNGWIIKPDEAIFNNATIRAKLSATIFEQGKVSAVGGILIIRPTSKIKKATFIKDEVDSNNNVIGHIWQIELEDSTGFDNSANSSQSFFITTINRPEGFYGEANIDKQPMIAAEEVETSETAKVLFNVKFAINSGEITESDLLSGFVINYGSSGSVGLGLNGSTNGAAITPSSFSVFEWIKNEDDGGGALKNRVVLGDLSKTGIIGLSSGSTFGLYAENAYLKGSLTTDVSSNSSEANVYAGINTLFQNEVAYSDKNHFPSVYSEVQLGELVGKSPKESGFFEKEENDYILTQDQSVITGKTYYYRSGGYAPIVFWAGANGAGATYVKDSNFYVDRNGNVFANSGYFSGTIITDATIIASKISTVEITGGQGTDGSENNDQKALIIRDDKALEIRDSTNELIMTVEKGSVALEKDVTFKIGDQTFGGEKTSSVSVLVGAENHSNSIYLSLPNYENSEEKDYAMIHFGTDGITNDRKQNGYDYKIGITGNETTTYGSNADLVISTNKDRLAYFSKTNNIGFEKTVTIKENLAYGGKNMEYRQVKDSSGAILGYDLYIQ